MAERPNFVLDACVLLRLAQDEPGAERVEALLKDSLQEKCLLLLHIINLGEVVYTIAKRFGWEAASRKRFEIERLPIAIVPFSEELFWTAVELKSLHPLSYADSFAAATALHHEATLLTTDPEFEALGSKLKRQAL